MCSITAESLASIHITSQGLIKVRALVRSFIGKITANDPSEIGLINNYSVNKQLLHGIQEALLQLQVLFQP